jgi:hypothetical protein
MFEEGGTYRNRRGEYTVLSISGGKMVVRFTDGTTATLNMGIQERIWENIVAETEAATAKKLAASKKAAVNPNNYYIKTLSITENELAIPGLKQRIAVTGSTLELKQGDRMIYFGIEPRAFFAVVTVTGPPKLGAAKDYQFSREEQVHIYPIDTDTHVILMENTVSIDTVELESLPNYKRVLRDPDLIIPVNEDDFELIAELVAESDEDEEEAALFMEDDDDLLEDD